MLEQCHQHPLKRKSNGLDFQVANEGKIDEKSEKDEGNGPSRLKNYLHVLGLPVEIEWKTAKKKYLSELD